MCHKLDLIFIRCCLVDLFLTLHYCISNRPYHASSARHAPLVTDTATRRLQTWQFLISTAFVVRAHLTSEASALLLLKSVDG